MESLHPGHYWKTPFLWEPGCAAPSAPPGGLGFRPVTPESAIPLIARAMASSRDESDIHAVSVHGELGAAHDLLSIAPQYFAWEPSWWRCAVAADDQVAGLVLPVVFKSPDRYREGRPQGTIFYMGVLPAFRGRGVGTALVAEATRVFIGLGCWRIFCDTGTTNEPMVRAFRTCGYMERQPWQRPLA